MADKYGPYMNHGRIHWVYSVAAAVEGGTTVRVSVTAFLQMDGSSYTNGTWVKGWSGYWGTSSGSQYINLGPGQQVQIVTGAYDVAQKDSSHTINFGASVAINFGTVSDVLSLTIPAKKLSKPGKATLTLSDATVNGFRATWKAGTGSGINNRQFQYSKSSTFASGVKTVTTASPKVVTGLASATKYYGRVRVGNNAGWGPWSNTQSITTLSAPVQVPISVVGTPTVSSAQIKFNSSSAGNKSAQIRIAENTAFTTGLKTVTTQGTASFTGLKRYKLYYYEARTQGTNGVWSGWYGRGSFRTAAEVPSAPSGYSPYDIASETAFSTVPVVSDTGGAALNGLELYVHTSASASGGRTLTGIGFDTPMIDGLTGGQQYYYRIRVQNSAGWSPWGPWVSFTTRSNVPSPPINLSKNAGDVLSWDEPLRLYGSTIEYYRITIGTNVALSTDVQTYATTDPEITSVQLNNLLPGKTYFVRVVSQSNNGPGSASALFAFSTGGTVVERDTWMNLPGLGWRAGEMKMRVSGSWRAVTVWQKINNVWRKL